MSKWVVQQYQSTGVEGPVWADIIPWDDETRFWDATDAGEALSKAVLQNKRHRIGATRYRVLRFDDGLEVNVNIGVEAVAHG